VEHKKSTLESRLKLSFLKMESYPIIQLKTVIFQAVERPLDKELFWLILAL
jgi:hypothetical protein